MSNLKKNDNKFEFGKQLIMGGLTELTDENIVNGIDLNSFFKIFSNSSSSSLSMRSDLLNAIIKSLSANSGLYFINSFFKTSKSCFTFFESTGMMYNKIEFRSICLKK